MSEKIREEVICILENYPETTRKISLLHYELEHPQTISPEELIGAMNFAHGDENVSPTPGHISNKTMYIALSYQEKAASANIETMDSIATKLFSLEREIDRLNYYLKLLDDPHRNIITLVYIDRVSWDDICRDKHISRRKANYLKAEAIDALVEMYSYTKSP